MTEPMTDFLMEHLRERASLAVLRLDAERRVREANAFARDLFGERLDGARLDDLTLDFAGTLDWDALIGDEAAHPVMLSVATRNGNPETLLFRFRRASDEIFAVAERDHAEVENLRTTLLDVNADLCNTARTLQKTNAELEHLNRVKNEFLGIAAHDLRSPIGAIRTYSELLIRRSAEALPEKHALYLHTIRRLSDFMLVLLNDLLDIAAIESGRVRLALEDADLAAVLREVVDLSAWIAERKRIAVRMELEREPCVLRMDPFKIRQVADNLLSNALKFSPEDGAVEVRLSTRSGAVRVAVRDEGPGVPPGETKKLFQPFGRTSVRASSGEKSTGLGLAIVKKIVDAHGGTVGVESAPGEGSTFHFTLPCRENEEVQP